MLKPRCSVCKQRCKTFSSFCSKKCEQKYNIKYARLIQWDKDNPTPTYKKLDERQKIVSEIKNDC